MDRRPVVWVAAAFVAGILIARYVPVPWHLPPAVMLLAVVPILVPRARFRGLRTASVLIAFVAAGAAATGARYAANANDPLSRSLPGDPSFHVTANGRVRAVPLMRDSMERAAIELDIHSLETGDRRLELQGKCLLKWENPVTDVLPGDTVRVSGYLGPLRRPCNTGTRTSADEWHRWGVRTCLSADGPQALQRVARGTWWSPRRLAARFRLWQAARLKEALPPEVLGFVYAVWLGDRDAIDHEELDRYRATGTAHILAVSGLHVGIFYISVAFVLGLVMRRSSTRVMFTMGAVALFVVMTGARLSALRAGLMVGVFLLAELFDRERDAPTALSLAGLILLLWNPLQLFSPTFQLSFACVASLLIFTEPIADALKGYIPYPANRALAAAVAVQILAVPIAAYHFQWYASLTPFVNIAVVPLLTVALWLCFLTSVTAVLSTTVAMPFGYALWPVVTVIRDTAALFDAPWNPDIAHVRPTVIAAVCYYLAVTQLPRALKPTRTTRRLALLTVVILLASVPLLWNARGRHPGVFFLDVGHGDASFIETPGGDAVLIDGGESNQYWRRGKRVVAPFLKSRGVRRLDYVVVSHADSDHIGGLKHIVESFDVGCLVRPPGHDDDALMQELVALCDERDVPVRTLWRGHCLELRGATLDVLHPPSPEWADRHSLNDASLVLRLDWEGPRVLFAGDIELLAERELVRAPCRAEVIKVPHHGSATSSSELLLDHVRPSMAVFSSGIVNRRRDIDPDVLERYVARGIAVQRTDDHGGVSLALRSGAVTVEGSRADQVRRNRWELP